MYLTAKDTLESKVEALRAGGDDYLTKPFSLAEIVARAHAILRRARGLAPGSIMGFADVILDEKRHEVFRGGIAVPSTRCSGRSRRRSRPVRPPSLSATVRR